MDRFNNQQLWVWASYGRAARERTCKWRENPRKHTYTAITNKNGSGNAGDGHEADGNANPSVHGVIGSGGGIGAYSPRGFGATEPHTRYTRQSAAHLKRCDGGM